jgi:hypothetical protein
MDGLDLIKREEIVGRIQWTDGGAMAGITETSSEVTVLATRTTIQQTGSTERESRTWRAHHAQEGSQMMG